MKERLQNAAWLPHDADIKVTRAKDSGRISTFNLVVGGEGIMGAVRLKIELWNVKPGVISTIGCTVSPVRSPHTGRLGVQAEVPTADLREILADKIFAIASRDRLKFRDIFDVAWLMEEHPSLLGQVTSSDMRTRRMVYDTPEPAEMVARLHDARRRLGEEETIDLAFRDLQQWLPKTWPLDRDQVVKIVASTQVAVGHGVNLFTSLGAAAKARPFREGCSPS